MMKWAAQPAGIHLNAQASFDCVNPIYNVWGENMNEVYVSMTNITKSFSGVEILHGVDLTLHRGEVLAFLGGNGAGKSTLVKILGGVHPKDSGKLELYGEEITGKYDSGTARKYNVTLIHQELSNCAHLTIAENIFLGREITKAGSAV